MSNELKYILSLRDLAIGYEVPLLKNISIDIQFTGLVGIIGNNGKGKTTLLKSIAGLQRPLSGQIVFDEKDIFGLSAAERSRIVSLNFASNYVSFPLSVYELVSMGRYPYNNHWAGLSREDEAIICNSIELCGIKDLQNKFVTSLSDGERQKAFIAKTLAQQTPLLLFDEPTAFLDYASKKHFFLTMKRIADEQQKIVIISSHDIDFLSAYSDHLLMIENDESILYDETTGVMRSEYFKEHFTKK